MIFFIAVLFMSFSCHAMDLEDLKGPNSDKESEYDIIETKPQIDKPKSDLEKLFATLFESKDLNFDPQVWKMVIKVLHIGNQAGYFAGRVEALMQNKLPVSQEDTDAYRVLARDTSDTMNTLEEMLRILHKNVQEETDNDHTNNDWIGNFVVGAQDLCSGDSKEARNDREAQFKQLLDQTTKDNEEMAPWFNDPLEVDAMPPASSIQEQTTSTSGQKQSCCIQ